MMIYEKRIPAYGFYSSNPVSSPHYCENKFPLWWEVWGCSSNFGVIEIKFLSVYCQAGWEASSY